MDTNSGIYAIISPSGRAYIGSSKLRRGIKQSPETVQKRVDKLKGRKRSLETVAKIAQANRGKKRSLEARKKMSEAKKAFFLRAQV